MRIRMGRWMFAAAVLSVCAAEAVQTSTELAREEFDAYVRRISGKAFPAAVEIGTLKDLGDTVPAAAREALGRTEDIEASWTSFDGKTLWIVGKDEVAELYAVYHFLESRLGVRWFQAKTPEDPGDYVPRMETIDLRPFEEFREPKFKIRRLELCHALGNVPATNAQTCAMRNGFQINAPYATRIPYENPKLPNCQFYSPRVPHRLVDHGGDHLTFVSTFPAKTSFKDHPEVFALLNGERRSGTQYCLSNPKLRDATVARIVRLFERDGWDGQFVFGQWDTSWGWCDCAACRALDRDDRADEGVPCVSSRFNDAVRYMAAKVWERNPKADLRMWAYNTYRKRPNLVRQDPRLKVCFCDHGRCYAHAIDDPSCSRNVHILSMLKEWLEVTPQVYVYGYLFCTEAYYSCNEMGMADDIRKYRDLGVMGWKEEASFSDSKFIHLNAGGGYRPDSFPSVWQTLYVTGHMLWDPDLDEKALIADAESKYYGAAYPAMKKYHDLRRKLWAEGKGCMGYPRGDQRRPFLLDAPGAKEKLLGYLDEAERLAGVNSSSSRKEADIHSPAPTQDSNSILKFRIGRDRRWLQTYWIEPNEVFKRKLATAFHAPKAETPIVIDGKGDDSVWGDAFVVKPEMFKSITKAEVPAEIANTVRILRDDENLYFLFEVKEPHTDRMKMHTKRDEPVWGDDGVEVFLYPPSIENKYYQIGMTAAGGISAETGPGGKAPGAFGTVSKGTIRPDGYTIEAKVPIADMYPLKDGELWRCNLCRSRVFRQEFQKHEEHYSIGGSGFRDTAGFHPLFIGPKR